LHLEGGGRISKEFACAFASVASLFRAGGAKASCRGAWRAYGGGCSAAVAPACSIGVAEDR